MGENCRNTGIICEYNPFHDGHAFQLARLRALGAERIAVVMSGSFTQRGEPAAADKRLRARWALQNGADLVLELPLPWAMAGAESFARGGIALLSALGVLDAAACGAESENAEPERTAEVLLSPEFSAALPGFLSSGKSFAAAREAAVRAVAGESAAALLQNPNDTLAVEYAKAILLQKSPLHIVPVQRVGAAHDAALPEKNFASASALRALLAEGATDALNRFVPADVARDLRAALSTGEAPALPERLERAILAKWRTISPEAAAALPDVSEGIENRIRLCAKQACSLTELYTLTKSKRYSHARIRRIVFSALLGLTAADAAGIPPYLRVLGLNGRGQTLLREAKSKASLPIVTRPGEIDRLGARAKRCFALECAATDLRALALPAVLPAGADYTGQIVFEPTAKEM